MRIISLVTICVMVIASGAHAQSSGDTSYHLLWYTGKQIKPNVLLTPHGDTITYTPSKGLVRTGHRVTAGNSNPGSGSGSGGQAERMRSLVKQNSRRMQDRLTSLGSSVPKVVLPPYSLLIRRGFEEVYNENKDLLTDTFSIPTIATTPLKGNTQGNNNSPAGYEDLVLRLIQELRSQKKKAEGESIPTPPAPPVKEYSYCNYSVAYLQNYQEQCKQYKAILFREEDEQQKKVGQVYDILRYMPEAAVNRVKVKGELPSIWNFWEHRRFEKTELLIKDYINDVSRCEAVMHMGAILNAEHAAGEGFGFREDYYSLGCKTLTRYLANAVKEKNYPIVLNAAFIFELEEMCVADWQNADFTPIENALALNQFKMTINLSAKINSEKGHILAAVKGDNYFYAIPDTSCTLQWYLAGPDIKHIKVDLTAAEVQPAEAMTYVGTKKWENVQPKMKVDFCGKGQDTIEFRQFNPEGHQELWQLPKPQGVINLSLVNTAIGTCFTDEQRLEEMKAKYKNHPENVEALKKQIMAQYEQMMKDNKNIKSGAAQMNMQDMAQWNRTQAQNRNITNIIDEANGTGYLFKPQVQNKNAIILNEKLNGKELFPKNAATEYAWFFLTLENDPEGPYKYKPAKRPLL